MSAPHPNPIRRRDFLRLSLATLAAAAWPFSACKIADADTQAPALPPVDGDAVGMVFDNHQHDAILAKADIEGGAALSVHIQGHALHDHTVELTAAQIADVRAGKETTLWSSNDWGHSHVVTFNRKKPT